MKQLMTSCLVAALLVAAAPAQDGGFFITDIGTLGGSDAQAYNLNEAGQVCGRSTTTGGDNRAFLWDPTAGMTDLGTLPGTVWSRATDVNIHGEVCGWCQDSVGAPTSRQAFLWLPNAKYGLPAGMNDLGNLGGAFTRAWGMNDLGEVVGESQDAGGNLRPFLWLPVANYGFPAGINDIGITPPGGGAWAFAWAINQTGSVSGIADAGGGVSNGWVWDATNGQQDVGTMGGPISQVRDINASGQIAGETAVGTLGNWISHALGGTAASPESLGTLPGFQRCFGNGINDHGDVVGFCSDFGFTTFAPFIARDGEVKDLNTLIPPNTGWTLTGFGKINNAAQVVGFGTLNGQTRAFLLDPVKLDFQITPNPVPTNTNFTLSVTGGVPNSPIFLGLLAFNFNEIPPEVHLSAPLDASGNFSLTLNSATGLSGFFFNLIVAGLNAAENDFFLSDVVILGFQ